MKSYCVTYSTTTYFAVIKARNESEARKKVIEVIGDPITVEDVYEVIPNEAN